MPLADRVRVARRFQRAIRIDTDLDSSSALDGFVCPHSFRVLLETMARHVSESSQGAFTWTGPYGSGKSSLAVVLSALLNHDKVSGRRAARLFGKATSAILRKTLPPRKSGWRILPIVGRRDRPEQVVGEALSSWVSLKVLYLCSGKSSKSLRSYMRLLAANQIPPAG